MTASIKNVFYIDPMSYNNLGEYDFKLISNIREYNIYFFGNYKFNFAEYTKFYPIFKYNQEDSRIVKTISYVISYLKILYYLIKYKPGIIHIQWFRLPIFDYYFLKLVGILLRNIKIIYTAHNILPHNSKSKYYRIYLRIYNSVDHIIVHSKVSKVELCKSFNIDEKKVSVIYHGILELKYQKATVECIKNSLINDHLLNEKIIFLYIGGISYYKGIDILWEAWNNSDYLRNSDHAVLIIAGKGSLEILDQNVIVKNVKLFNRFLTDDEFIAFIELANVIVLPYREISQSGVLLTSINYKKPVIVSNVGGLTDPFEFGKIGWTFKRNDVRQLEFIIKNIIKNREVLSAYSIDANWKNVLEKYNWVNIGCNTKLLYDRIISNRNTEFTISKGELNSH
jgi:glycosyltransferase involved in cell wall biosynthesis